MSCCEYEDCAFERTWDTTVETRLGVWLEKRLSASSSSNSVANALSVVSAVAASGRVAILRPPHRPLPAQLPGSWRCTHLVLAVTVASGWTATHLD